MIGLRFSGYLNWIPPWPVIIQLHFNILSVCLSGINTWKYLYLLKYGFCVCSYVSSYKKKVLLIFLAFILVKLIFCMSIVKIGVGSYEWCSAMVVRSDSIIGLKKTNALSSSVCFAKVGGGKTTESVCSLCRSVLYLYISEVVVQVGSSWVLTSLYTVFFFFEISNLTYICIALKSLQVFGLCL